MTELLSKEDVEGFKPENIARTLLQARYGETSEPAIKFVAAQIEAYANWRVGQEREACAQVATQVEDYGMDAGDMIAAAIRARA